MIGHISYSASRDFGHFITRPKPEKAILMYTKNQSYLIAVNQALIVR